MHEDLRILIVEDVAADAELVEHELRRAGLVFGSRRVETEGGFLGSLRDFRPDLILADYTLPQFTALDALRLLREQPRRVPFILVTGTQSEEVAVACMREGADDYILKDSLKRLPSALRNVMEKWATERKKEQAEAARRQSEAKYRLIADNTLDLICLLDRERRIVYVSPSCEQLLGYAAADLVGRQAESLVHGEDRPTATQAFQEALPAAGGGRAMQLRLAHRSGETRVFEAVGSWIRDGQGTPQSAVIVCRDITERQHAEEQLRRANLELAAREQALLEALADLRRSHEQLQAAQLQLIQAEKMESVGRLAAGVAHEVKNPLSVILMGVEYLRKHVGRSDDEVGAALCDMDGAVKRADAVVRGLLDFSAPGTLDRRDEDLNGIVRQALLLVRHELARGRVQVVQELAPQLPALRLDRNKIEQVFVNLFLNAIQAQGESGGTLTVRTGVKSLREAGSGGGKRPFDPLNRGGSVVVAEIEDTGSGIPADQLSKIFDPFFTTKPSGTGTGLGLTVVQKIVELHGGTIAVVNRREGGVRVTLLLSMDPQA